MPQYRLVRILSEPGVVSVKFSLDNDVLSEILNNQNETAKFVLLLNTNDIEIHISSEVHSESIFGGDRERVVARQTNLVPILKTKKVRLLKGIREIVQGEMRHSFLPPLSPFRPDYFVENASVQFADQQWLGAVHDQTEPDRKQHHEAKVWAHQSDKKLAAILPLNLALIEVSVTRTSASSLTKKS